MLSNNNMLTTGGNARPRARRSVIVDEPAYGFFIAGSSIEAMNGNYVRKNPPRAKKTDPPNKPLVALYYEHEEGGWHMALNQLPTATQDEEEDDDDDDYYYYRARKKKPTHEWVFIDEFGVDRFSHGGDTIVPGAGVSWKHVHRGAAGSTAAGSVPETTDVAEIKPDDEDELPWQVIAILDVSTLQDLLWSSEYRKQKVRDAKAGKNAPKPAKSSLEASVAPGKWLFRVVAEDGVSCYLTPDDEDEASDAVGHCKQGSYLRGVELGPGGEWLRLDSSEDVYKSRRVVQARFNPLDHFDPEYDCYNADYARREVWVRVYGSVPGKTGTVTMLEEVSAEETAVLNLTDAGDCATNQGGVDDTTGSSNSSSSSSSSSAAVASNVGKISAESHNDGSGGSGLTGDLFDKPFVPRMEESERSEQALADEELLVALRAGRDPDTQLDAATATLVAATTAAVGGGGSGGGVGDGNSGLMAEGVPVGVAVCVAGLRTRAGAQYNGVSGVVVTPPDAETGRQGVRLDAPFSGKVLACRPDSLVFCEDDDEDDADDANAEDDLDDEGEEEQSKGTERKIISARVRKQLDRAARVLGLSFAQLENLHKQSQLKTAAAAAAASDSIDGDTAAATAAAAVTTGQSWGIAGSSAQDRVCTAVRACVRDAETTGTSAIAVARTSGELLRSALTTTDDADTVVYTSSLLAARSPSLLLRSGALGSRAAAAMVAAINPLNNQERTAGITALRQLIRDETQRVRGYRESVMVQDGEDSEGRDELLLRLCLVEALLFSRREAEALEESRFVSRFEQSELLVDPAGGYGCPAVSVILARCLLRLGHRADGLTILEKAEHVKPTTATTAGATAAAASVSDEEEDDISTDLNLWGTAGAGWLAPLWAWGRREAAQLLAAHRGSERCRVAAVDAYARGAFEDAALLYGRSLTLLTTGFADDKRGRSTALADRAGCLRRARKLDDAVSDLDAALRLFPRYERALFRRAACLLEAGKAAEAIDGFKDLYRVNRDWPMLSEWLVRACGLQKRQAKGYKGAAAGFEQYENPSEKSGGPDNSNGSGKDIGATGDANADADMIAKEVDHYTVLGVSTDATEKQLKTAYRMRSLKFHPDRKAGNTAAFQRIAEAYEILSDADKRRGYDEGVDIKVKRGKKDDSEDDSSEDEEEHKTTLREEVEREYYPERYHFWPFGDPFIYKRKREAQKRAREGRPAWHEEAWA